MRRMFSLKQLEEIADTRIKALVEGGTLENAKPIYYHPIIIQSDLAPEDTGFVISLAIINNDPTPFTFESLIAWAEALEAEIADDVCLNASGYYKSGVYEVTSISYLLITSDKSWRIRGGMYDTLKPVNISLNKATFAALPVQTFYDGVNKIN